ncbi:hypothetical protein V8E51_017389 [Hyaloscypha variabilis]
MRMAYPGVLPPCSHPAPSSQPASRPVSAYGLRTEYLQPASSRNRWHARPSRGSTGPARSVPAFGFIGPASPCDYALSVPFTLLSKPEKTTKADDFLHLLPAPVIVWTSSSVNRSKECTEDVALAQYGNLRKRRLTLRSPPTGETGMISTTKSKSLAHFASRLSIEPTPGLARAGLLTSLAGFGYG